MANSEFSLDSLLVDPMVRLVMSSDGVEEERLRDFLEGVRDRLQRIHSRDAVRRDPCRSSEAYAV